MADSKNSAFFFLFLLIISAQAREVKESHFFNKAARETTVDEPQIVGDKPLETNLKQEEPVNFATQERQNGYGLYGNNNNNNMNENYVEESSLAENYSNNDNNDNNYYDNMNYNARFNPTKFAANEYNQQRNYYNKDSYPTKQNVDEPYGMSDTRFLEKGRYFYDINAENNGNNYRFSNDNNMGYYGSSQRRENRNYYNNKKNNYNYYGNNENSFEYNNEMRRFSNHQEAAEEEYEP